MKSKDEITRLVGKKFRTARLANNLTIRYVVDKVFDGNGNRLSEIEHGMKLPTVTKMIELAQLYGVSLDYIFGLSPEYESNVESFHTGLIVNTMREASLDLADRVSESLIMLSKKLPNHQGQLLLDSAKRCLKDFDKHRHDLVFSAEYGSLCESMKDLQHHIHQTENAIARSARLMEVAYQEALDEAECVMLYSRKKQESE